MFDYTHDPETGGLLLNDRTPTGSKEPRPVYAAELDLLHMDRFWQYEKQTDVPYMWAESATYIYRGIPIAKVNGGSLCEAPTVDMLPAKDAKGNVIKDTDGKPVPALPQGTVLLPVDIDAMATVLNEHISSIADDAQRLEALCTRLLDNLNGLAFITNGAKDHILGSLSISFRDIEGEVLLHRLDIMGISVATGSACNSKETVLSHVIKAIGLPEEYASGTIRITLGMDNDEVQIDRIAESLRKIVLGDLHPTAKESPNVKTIAPGHRKDAPNQRSWVHFKFA